MCPFIFEMGRRRFFCDFCDKRIPSGLNHRKTHQQSIQHLQNKANYYRQYQVNPTDFLREEQLKRLCHQWFQRGSCSYRDKCKYSHRSNEELIRFIEQGIFYPVSISFDYCLFRCTYNVFIQYSTMDCDENSVDYTSS